jgi:hypothetical protein
VAQAALADLVADDEGLLAHLESIGPSVLDRAWELLVAFWAAAAGTGRDRCHPPDRRAPGTRRRPRAAGRGHRPAGLGLVGRGRGRRRARTAARDGDRHAGRGRAAQPLPGAQRSLPGHRPHRRPGHGATLVRRVARRRAPGAGRRHDPAQRHGAGLPVPGRGRRGAGGCAAPSSRTGSTRASTATPGASTSPSPTCCCPRPAGTGTA